MRRFAPALALALAACAGPAVRDAAYPAGVSYVPRAEVRETMQAMARAVGRLDVVLHDESGGVAQQAEVVALLHAVEREAAALRSSGGVTNHPILDARLPAFLVDVENARAAASADPPAYFLARNVAGSCAACHAAQGGAVARGR